jgi:type II secretory pathway pseudopilin PulG
MSLSSLRIKSAQIGHAQTDSCRAFTLFEVLIATAIVVFLVAMLAQILSATQGIWRNAEARSDPFRDARAAIELMSRELALAIPNDKAPVLALDNICPAQTGDANGPDNQQIYALLPARNVDTNNPAVNRSDVCAVGFYCVWDNSKHAYILRRHFFASDATFSRLQSAGLPAAPPPASSVYAPSNPAVPPAQDEDVAAYVWDLKIKPYEFDPGTGTLTATTTYPITYNTTLPQFIEISFKAMSPQAARKLTAQNVGSDVWFPPDPNNPPAIYRNQILPAMHEFKIRIKLHNALKP